MSTNKKITLFNGEIPETKVDKKIGDGSFSLIYEIKSTIGNKYILKFPKSDEGQISNMNSMIREISILLKLSHPNICPISGFHYSPEQRKFMIFMPPLNSDLCSFKFSQFENKEDLIRLCFGNVLSGLSYIHNKNIIHRDISPSNILVNVKDGGISFLIGDFGLSKDINLTSSNDMSNYITAYPFRAPEVVLDLKYGKEVDIWSLGATFYSIIHSNFNDGDDKVTYLSKYDPSHEYKEYIYDICRVPGMRDYLHENIGQVKNITSEDIDSNGRKDILRPRKYRFEYDVDSFILSMLKPDPKLRPRAEDLLSHNFIGGNGVNLDFSLVTLVSPSKFEESDKEIIKKRMGGRDMLEFMFDIPKYNCYCFGIREYTLLVENLAHFFIQFDFSNDLHMIREIVDVYIYIITVLCYDNYEALDVFSFHYINKSLSSEFLPLTEFYIGDDESICDLWRYFGYEGSIEQLEFLLKNSRK